MDYSEIVRDILFRLIIKENKKYLLTLNTK